MINWWKTKLNNKKILLRIQKSLKNRKISEGPLCRALEKKISKILNVKYVVLTNNGSIALLMSLIALNIKKNDEIILSNCGWVSTIHAAKILGAKIKLIDVEKHKPVISIKNLSKEITSKTKVIIPTHLNGSSANISAIKKIIKKKKIYIIEDAAQALFSKNKKKYLGTIGDIGCFSLSIPKALTAGQGGFCCTNSKKIYEKLKIIKTQGMRDVFFSKWNTLGFNFKFNDISASVCYDQFVKYKSVVNRFKKIYKLYKLGIHNLKIKYLDIDYKNGEFPIYNQVITSNPSKLINFLKKKGIESRPGYRNLSRAKYALKSNKNFSNSRYFEKIVILPSGPDQNLKDIIKIVKTLNKYK